MRISLVDPSRALSTPPMPPQIVELARADSGARRSASRRFFADAQRSTDTATRLRLDGYDLIGWSSGEGAVIDVQVD